MQTPPSGIRSYRGLLDRWTAQLLTRGWTDVREMHTVDPALTCHELTAPQDTVPPPTTITLYVRHPADCGCDALPAEGV